MNGIRGRTDLLHGYYLMPLGLHTHQPFKQPTMWSALNECVTANHANGYFRFDTFYTHFPILPRASFYALGIAEAYVFWLSEECVGMPVHPFGWFVNTFSEENALQCIWIPKF